MTSVSILKITDSVWRVVSPLRRLDCTGNSTASLDLDLPISDLTGNQTSGADDQPFVDHEITLETATYFGVLDRGGAVE